MLLPLVDEIKKITDDKDLMYLFDVDVDDMYSNKFPYEVVYDQRFIPTAL